jgi:sporulation protein YpjB
MLMVKGGCPMFVYLDGRKWMFMIAILMAVSLTAACGAPPKTASVTKKADPQQLRKMELLNETADEMYKKAMEGRMMEARNMLLQISDQITRVQFQGVTSIEGLHALTESITHAKRVYNAASLSPSEGQIAAAQIRLATDALTHQNQPMWLQYDKLLRNALSLLEQAVKETKEQEALASFAKFKQYIFLIHPSLLISREPPEVEKLDSLLAFVQTEIQKNPMAVQNVLSGVDQMHRTLDEIFRKKTETTAYLPIADHQQPIVWALGIGAIISSVLVFAGWRMFKSNRGAVTVNKKEDPGS